MPGRMNSTSGERMQTSDDGSEDIQLVVLDESHTKTSKSVTYQDSGYSRRLLGGLQHLWECQQLFDVTLLAEDQEFHAHKVVLASCSLYFRAMFTNGLRETSQTVIRLRDFHASVLSQLIHYAYTSEINITEENLEKMLSGATYLQILPVVQACEAFLCSHIAYNNCARREELSHIYNLPKLKEKVLCYLCKNLNNLVGTPCLRSFTARQFKAVLQSGFPTYCAEAKVVEAICGLRCFTSDEGENSVIELLNLVMPHNLHREDVYQLLRSNNYGLQEIRPEIKSLMLHLGDAETKLVPGVINTRGFFETIVIVGGMHASSRFSKTDAMLYLDCESSSLVPFTRIPHVKQATFGVAVRNNRMFVAGGSVFDANNCTEVTLPNVFMYCPDTNEWLRLNPMQQERCRFYFGELNGLLYAIGGEVDNSHSMAECEVYDPDKDAWTLIQSMPEDRSEMGGTNLRGCLFVSGGKDTFDRVGQGLWYYHPSLELWGECAPMLSPRADHTMFTHKDSIYVIGGWNQQGTHRFPVMTVDRYDVQRNTWQTVLHTETVRWNCSCTLFQGKVYVIGGDRRDEFGIRCVNQDGNGNGKKERQGVDILDLETMSWLENRLSLPSVWDHMAVTLHLPRTDEPEMNENDEVPAPWYFHRPDYF